MICNGPIIIIKSSPATEDRGTAVTPLHNMVQIQPTISDENRAEIRIPRFQAPYVPKSLAQNGANFGWALPDLNRRSTRYERVAFDRTKLRAHIESFSTVPL